MKLIYVSLAITVLVFASQACQTLTGGGNASPTLPPGNENSGTELPEPTSASPEQGDTNDSITNTDFPVTADTYNVRESGGSLIIYTMLSIEETMNFNGVAYTSRGYREREILTQVSDGTLSIVFNGEPSRQAIVIQSVDHGGGSRTVSRRLEDV